MAPEDLPVALETDRLCLRLPWSEAVWREELASPFGLYLAMEEGGEPVGHVGLKVIGPEAHVMTLAVRPQHRRRGHARALVRAGLDLAREAGALEAQLEVRPSNAAARSLYASLGFSETGRRPRYYGDEDALLMTLKPV
jgi:ribosomal-protein-alanine N-acetyltransferase